MRYRDILVHLDSEPATAAGDRRRAYAVSLARTFEAHLTGVIFDLEPQMPGLVMADVPADFMHALRRESAAAAWRAAEAFSQAGRTEAISHESRILRAIAGAAPDQLASHGRVVDLIVVGQRDPSEETTIRSALIEAALFETGRPALIVPYVGHDRFRWERIIVAWDGGREATRAAHDALPALVRAKSVEVVVIGERTQAAQSDEPGGDLALHLARHGVSVTAKRISAADIDVGSAVLSHAADFGADLLVMGGFARPRLRQFILGGMTRSVLDSMTLPVLMSH